MKTTTILAVLAVLAGCERKSKDPTPRVETGLTEGQVQDRIAEIGKKQAAGFTDGKAELLRAFNAPGTAPAGTRLVGAELRLELPGGSFDPDDIDVVDAETNENHGSGPLLQRLTDAGEMADWQDPVFTDQHKFRIIAVWAVPPGVRRIRLEYWGQRLAGPAEITGSGPALKDGVTEQVTGFAKLGPGRFGLQVECDCARTAQAPWFQLVDGTKLVSATRTLEVDPQLAPVTAKLETRPFYSQRRWILEFVIAGPSAPREVNQFGQRTPVPTTGFALPAATLAALAAAPAKPE